MILRRLRDLIDARENLDALLARFRGEHGSEDPIAFAVFVYRNGWISGSQLTDLLTEGLVDFSGLDRVEPRSAPSSGSRYELLTVLGRGSMGTVHLAHDHVLHRNVAVKVMDGRLALDPVLVKRFITEVQITAKLDHPSVVPVHGLEVQPDGSLGYAMRIVRGRTLTQLIEDVRRCYAKQQRPDQGHDLPARLLLVQELANALHYAHLRGVVHRDLKPDNIMIGPLGEVMVMDWGIARIMGRAEEKSGSYTVEDAPATQYGSAIGTPPFMSPEQAQGQNDVLDGRSDQYALGLILFELVSLRRAVTGQGVPQVLLRAASGEKDPLVHMFGEKIPKGLAAIIHKATSYHADDRYADCASLGDDVLRFVRDEPVQALPDRGLQRVTRWISRNREKTLAMVFLLTLSIIFIVVGSVAVGTTWVLIDRYRAEVREQRLTHVLGVVGEHAHHIDTEFQNYEAEVSAVVSTSEYALRQPLVPPVAVYWAEDFRNPKKAPSDLLDSKIYKGPASPGFVDVVVAPGVDRAGLMDEAQRLSSVQPQLLGALLHPRPGETWRSWSSADAERRILEEGGPVIWSYIGLEDGILVGMPGSGDYPADYDPRRQSWYQIAFTAHQSPQWEVSEDESGQGVLATCSEALHDPSGQPIGVAALDLTLSYVTNAWLDTGDLPGASGAYLVDGLGMVVGTNAGLVPGKDRRPFAFQELMNAIKVDESQIRPANGHFEVDDSSGSRMLVVWYRLRVDGWIYVVMGPSSTLIDPGAIYPWSKGGTVTGER